MDLDEEKVRKKNFKIILDLKCLSMAPILIRLKNAKISDILDVLALGVLDIIENIIQDNE